MNGHRSALGKARLPNRGQRASGDAAVALCFGGGEVELIEEKIA